MIRVNRTGQRFGRLKVTRCYQRWFRYGWQTLCVCACDCGNESTVRVSNLVGGTTRSCGCLRVEMNRREAKAKLNLKKKGGLSS